MGVENFKFLIGTRGFNDIIDITRQVADLVSRVKERNALVHVYTVGSTVSIITLEYEPGLVQDLPEILDEIAPINRVYHHDEKWHDGNGYAHIRSALLGNGITIPLVEGELMLGQWQQVILIDFDNKARSRQIIVQVIY
ncbi:putative secondary thiamine-phosphate synthase enzyme [Candidatus Gastranaerophilus sp. (ex Termes propinquus)]|nr:putative secondary thiamine-phosphate synthase enzyme [Candidatus Gastranaerophilus sp. (ex Termes propinquus)]